MRILIISKHFYPKQNPRAFRAFELAKEFAMQGHEVKVYTATGNFDYTETERKYGFKVANLGKMKFARVTNDGSQKIRKYHRLLNSLLGRLIHFPEIETAIKIPKLLRSEKFYDILISLALPHPTHWGCAMAFRKNRMLAKTWIADCGDPLTGNKFSNYPFYFRYVENWVFNIADYITVPIKEALDAYDTSLHHKIRVIPQGFKFDNVRTSAVRNDEPTFAFAGAFYENKRDPREFLDYLLTLKTKFKFIVYTNNDSLLYQYKTLLSEKLVIRKYIERSLLLEELCKMDFLINFENLHTEQSPSKLIDYAITNRPILSVPSKHINKRIIDEFLVGDYTNGLKIDNIEIYKIENVVSKFIELHLNNSKSLDLNS